MWLLDFLRSLGPYRELDGAPRQLGSDGIGQTLNWAWSWPANRRVLYNRAGCDLAGKPYDPNRKLISWNGSAWVGADVPDFKIDENPGGGMGPFIMNPEGVARFFGRAAMAEGPSPEHY